MSNQNNGNPASNHTPEVSVIVTSYNQLKTLRLLFASLGRQTFENFEVVIADDGSSDGTDQFCRSSFSFKIKFITQPDIGYRKAKILNEAIRNASADYLIFLDGDVILERHFIEDHLFLRKQKHFVCGRRVDLGPVLSSRIDSADVERGRFDRPGIHLILSALKKDTSSLKRGVRIPLPQIRKFLRYHRPLDLLGSNFSAWKTDLIEVNGFNEALESYWGEDGDLFIRLRNAGKQSIGAKGICIQYHVYHPRREPTPENIKKYDELLKDNQYKWAARGIL